MGKRSEEVIKGVLIEEDSLFTLVDLCRSCGVNAGVIVEMVEEGILEPIGDNTARWCFKGSSLRRVTRVMHLQQDLGVNLAGAALAIDLLDRIEHLQARLRMLEHDDDEL